MKRALLYGAIKENNKKHTSYNSMILFHVNNLKVMKSEFGALRLFKLRNLLRRSKRSQLLMLVSGDDE